MKGYRILFLTSMLFVSSCFSDETNQQGQESPFQASNILKNTKELNPLKPGRFTDVELVGLENGIYIREELENTLLLKRRGYQGAEHLKIRVDNYSEPLYGIVYYGANQYTIDDNPAFPLKASFQDYVVLHKDSYGNYNLSTILKSEKEIEHLIETKYFDLFLDESIEAQKEVYSMVLNDKVFFDCCPEYIENAKYFFDKKKYNFKSFDDLKLSPIYKKIVLNIGKDRKFIYIN